MQSASIPLNENARLAALHEYAILDSAPEQAFDELAKLASILYGCPIATINFIDRYRYWCKATDGIPGGSGQREHSFCAHTILQDDVFIVEDATADERFAQNPFVVNKPGIRFYAAAPIVSASGYNIGAVCVVDKEPRRLTKEQASGLQYIAGQVTKLLELRQKTLLLQVQAQEMIANEKRIAQDTVTRQEDERAYISRELHENLAQSLAAVKLYLEYAREEPELQEAFLQKSTERLSVIINDVRSLSKAIVPTALVSVGIAEALAELLDEFERGTACRAQLQMSPSVRLLQPQASLALYRVVQEQLKNIRQHARATRVWVELQATDDLVLTVCDDGVGVNLMSLRKGFGFNNMVTRLEQLGGSADLSSAATGGCRLTARLPLAAALRLNTPASLA